MGSNINEIVSEILSSSELRNTLENAVRNLSVNRSPGSAVPPQVPLPICTPNTVQNPNPWSGQLNTPLASRSASILQEVRRNFPSIRGTLSNGHHERKGCKRKRKIESYFQKDVYLVRSPSRVNTLKGLEKFYAAENGYIVSGVQFNVDWSHEEVVKCIKDLFHQHLGEIDFEIMVPIGGRLTKPNLPPSKTLDGTFMKSIFVQKYVYVRPLRRIVTESPHELQLDEDPVTGDLENSNVDISNPNEISSAENFPNVYVEKALQDDMELAIKNSLDDLKLEVGNTLEEIVRNLQQKIDNTKISHFNIYRNDIFKCCVKAMNRKSFSVFNKISVKFSDIEGISEGAIDVGGPTREMFRLALKFIENSTLFFGENNKYIRLDCDMLEKRYYFEAGRFISLSLIHGGPAVHFLSENLFTVLTVGVSDTVPNLNDVEEDIREKIAKTNEFNDLRLLQDYISEEPIFAIAGCHSIKRMEQKENLLRDVVQFYAFHRLRLALDQFRDGLSTGNILDLIKIRPDIFKEFLCGHPQPITADTFQQLYEVHFSDSGSSRREIENRVITFWRDYIMDSEEEETEVTPQEIFVFCTGAGEIPPLGFDLQPIIKFSHDQSVFPTVSTCSLTLDLPTVHKTYEDFKNALNFGIRNADQFGFA